MIDLHLHLDGSMTAKDIIYLASLDDVLLPTYDIAELENHIIAPEICDDLNDYLKRFVIPVSVLQTSKAISFAVSSLIKSLHALGILYAEIRFAPQLHTEKGMTQEEVVSSAIMGLNDGIKACNGEIKAQLILCCMRGEELEENNMATVKIAHKYYNKGVCAVDLAGAEAIYKTSKFKEVFAYARSIDMPFTIHAGEADSYESVETAIELGAKRIGHGIRALESIEIMDLLKEKKIPLEMCPTSNFQTRAVAKNEQYPLRKILTNGILATINTDNMTVSNTNIEKEYELLRSNIGLTQDEEYQLLINSVNSIFVNDFFTTENQKELKERIDVKFSKK